jgi:hypothetical protein
VQAVALAAALVSVTSLTSLDVSHQPISQGTKHFPSAGFACNLAKVLPFLTNLTDLAIDQLVGPCNAGTALCAALTQLPKLRRLSAQGAHLNTDRMQQLSCLLGYVIGGFHGSSVLTVIIDTACMCACACIAIHSFRSAQKEVCNISQFPVRIRFRCTPWLLSTAIQCNISGLHPRVRACMWLWCRGLPDY